MKPRRVLVALCAVGAVATAGAATTVAAVAASSSSTHTLKFTAITKSHHGLSRSTQIEADTDKSGGKTVGYNVLYEKFTRSSGSVSGAYATKGGLIFFEIKSSGPSAGATLDGTLTGGTGKYKNVHGTITANTVSKAKTIVTITYH